MMETEKKVILDRLNAERKKCAGRWQQDRYWLGYTDAMRKAMRIVDGSIDEPSGFYPSMNFSTNDNNG